jgi:hypothetical protein
MNTETFDWAEMAAMLSPQKPAPTQPPGETAGAHSDKTLAHLADLKLKESLKRAEERQRLVDMGYPGLAEHFFNEQEESKPLPTGTHPTSKLSAKVLARIEKNRKTAQERLEAKNHLNQSKKLLSTAAPPAFVLSAEVLARIERNRKAAQDRLEAKNRPISPIVTAALQPVIPFTAKEICTAQLKRKTQAESEKAASWSAPLPTTPVEEIESEVAISTQHIQYHFEILRRGIKLEPI